MKSNNSDTFSRFAQKVPKVLKTGDAFKDQQRTITRKKFVTLIDKCMQHPQFISSMLDTMEDFMQCATEEEMRPQEALQTSSNTCIKTLDEGWLASFVASTTGFDEDQLQRAKQYDPDSIRHMACKCLNAELSLKLTDDCNDPVVLTKVFQHFAAECPNKLKSWQADKVFVGNSGNLNWPVVGVYKFHWCDEAKVYASLEHTPSGDIIDIRSNALTRQMEVMDNWSASRAKIFTHSNQRAGLLLKDFFPKSQGPHRVKPMQGRCKKFMDQVDVEVRKMKEVKKQHLKSEMTRMPSFGKDGAANASRQKNIEKARAMLVKRKEELKNKRRLKVEKSTASAE